MKPAELIFIALAFLSSTSIAIGTENKLIGVGIFIGFVALQILFQYL